MVKILKHLTREALESEVMRLRQALETSAGQTLVSGAQRDIAAQLAASRAALAASEARQRAILECAIDFAMVATDPRGNITEWNAGAVNVMGWSAEEVLGQSAAIFSRRRIAPRAALKWKCSALCLKGAPPMSVGTCARTANCSGRRAN